MTKKSATTNSAPALVNELLQTNKVKKVVITAEYSNSARFSKMKEINDFYCDTGTLDLVELMDELSSGARKLFIRVKRSYNYKTGTAHLPTTGMSKGQINKRAIYFKELAEYSLVKKVPCTKITNIDGIECKYPSNTYMISPEYFPPKYDDLILKLHHLWNQL